MMNLRLFLPVGDVIYPKYILNAFGSKTVPSSDSQVSMKYTSAHESSLVFSRTEI